MIRVYSYDWGHYEPRVSNGQLVDEWVSHRANSAGGVTVKYSVSNYGTKTVRSYSIWFAAFNGAYEPVRCTVTDLCTKGVNSHDPISPNGNENNSYVENLWYNHSIRYVTIDHIDVTYTDGTTESCEGNYSPSAAEEKEHSKEGWKQGLLGCLMILIFGAMLVGSVLLLIHGFMSWLEG